MIAPRQLLVVALMLAVVATAVAVAYSKHQSRQLFVRLQALNSERDALDIEWGRLQLEQSTLATPIRIENIARKRLGMFVPSADEIVIIKNETR
jgi:cell division protein FtsL